jgi:flagellin-like protein
MLKLPNMNYKTHKGGLKTKMNTYQKLRKSKKALSPVVASIILIAVTVAVSVVVAAWMGGMSLGLMGNAEQLKVTNVQFNVADPTNTITISVQNNGGADATISKLYINGQSVALINLDTDTLIKGAITDVTITYAWTASTSYELKFTTAAGNNVAYTQVSPAVDA